MLRSWLALASLAAGVWSQDCGREMAACLAEAGIERPDPRAGQEAKAAKLEAVSACFQEAGCEDPVPKLGELKNCIREQLGTLLLAPMVACVEGKGVEVPEEILAKFEGADGGESPPMLPFRLGGGRRRGFGKKGKKGGGKAHKLRQLASSACPSEAALEGALACAAEAKSSGGKGAHGGGGVGAGIQKFMAMRRCKESLSEECKARMAEAKAAVCECAEGIQVSEADATAAIGECKARAGLEGGEGEAAALAQKAGKLKQMAKHFCRAGGRGGGGRRGRRGRRGRG